MTENKPQHSPLISIKEKCEQYWNEHNICDSEVHAILAFIHEEADTMIDIHNDLLAACEAVVRVIEYSNKPTLANQGQAMDGYSQLANFQEAAKKCQIAIAKAKGEK